MPARQPEFTRTALQFGPDEGLTTAVNRLLQDRDGFLWVSTFNASEQPKACPALRYIACGKAPTASSGRVRVDTLLAEESEALTDLDFDAQGRLYLGTVKGLLIGEALPDGAIRFHFANGVPRVPKEPAGDQAVMGIGERKHRQEGNRLTASPADAAPNSNPVMVFIMGLLAPTAMADDRIPRANRTTTDNYFRSSVCPIGSPLARRRDVR